MARAKLKLRTNVSEFTIRDEASVPDGQWERQCQRRVTQHSSLGEWKEKWYSRVCFQFLRHTSVALKLLKKLCFKLC